jgi:SAM-dependent methyltransferase
VTSGNLSRPSELGSGEAESSYPGEQTLFDELFLAEDRHFWFTSRNEIIRAALQRATISLPPDSLALEVGCGTGNVLRVLEAMLGSARVVGIDLFAGGLRYARQRTSCLLIQADMHRAPFAISFGLVGMFDVIEHLADDVAALKQVNQLLEDGGKLLLTVPAHTVLWSYADEFAGHQRRYGPQELTQKLEESGFVVEYTTQFMAVLFPLIWVGRNTSKWLNRLPRRSSRDLFLKELRPVAIMNDVLGWILRLEARLIAKGQVLPIGASLLVIARKAVATR